MLKYFDTEQQFLRITQKQTDMSLCTFTIKLSLNLRQLEEGCKIFTQGKKWSEGFFTTGKEKYDCV